MVNCRQRRDIQAVANFDDEHKELLAYRGLPIGCKPPEQATESLQRECTLLAVYVHCDELNKAVGSLRPRHSTTCPGHMADYHTVYKGPEGQTTQWDDIQRKLGNLPAKAPVKKPDPWTPDKEEGKSKEWVDSKAADELEEMDDEFDDDRFLEQYR